MKALYACDKCGLDSVEVEVPARGPEDVVAYLERIVAPLLAADHNKRSPRCRPKKFAWIKLPVSPGPSGRVGEETKH